MAEFAPIALFAYKRPEHLQRTVTALQANLLAGESRLHIFADGARSGYDLDGVRAVRAYCRKLDGFKSVELVERPTNLGLAASIISGVQELIAHYGQVIVVEDDLVTSPYFLEYMNDALRRYRFDERVISVHGYIYPVHSVLPETFFLKGADCWGWGTWERGWCQFEPEGNKLLAELKRRGLCSSFDMDDSYPYTAMLRDQIAGRNDSWAIRWYASAFLADRLTLYPGRSLVTNIGNDASGTHCTVTDRFSVPCADAPVQVNDILVEEHTAARQAVVAYLQKMRPSYGERLRQAFRRCIA